MAAQQGKLIPQAINLDAGYENLADGEVIDIRNYTGEIEKNANLPTGTGNDTDEGQNEYVLKPIRANVKLELPLPEGININIGSFESITTRELYVFNYNSNGQHGIYMIDGDTMQQFTVIVDPALQFSNNPEAFIAAHRVTMRVTFDTNKNILEKSLILTDGNTWQKWVNVVSAIKTNGFNAVQFPYFELKQPHFDRREYVEYAVRPPMITPKVSTLPNRIEDANVPNRMIDKAFQFSYQFVYTDGRETLLSPWSLPLIVQSATFLSDPNAIPKRGAIKLYGGSGLVEKVRLYVRTQKNQEVWFLYDTIEKYSQTGANAPNLIGNEYWRRVNPYDGLGYDAVQNTFNYVFSFDKVYQIASANTVNIYQNGLPLRSVACCDVGDAVLFSNNEYNYPQIPQAEIEKFELGTRETQGEICNVPTRRISLYATLVRDRANSDVLSITQPPYINSEEDDIVRFGAADLTTSIVAGFSNIEFDLQTSEFFELNFADRNSLRCYLKGTQYFADGKWFTVNRDFQLEPIAKIYNLDNVSERQGIRDLYKDQRTFVCRFDFVVPAGIYTACLGRHNEPSTGDWINKSTYVVGIANSRLVNVQNGIASYPYISSIVSFNKEIEINCLSNDVDVWGNGSDLFWVAVPHITNFQPNPVKRTYKLIEGYFYETPSEKIPVEKYSYTANLRLPQNQTINGRFTDKNGFFFVYITGGNEARRTDVIIYGNKDCSYQNEGDPIEFIDTPNGNFSKDNEGFLDNNVLGACNRVLVRGRITNPTGVFGYSNVSVHIAGGAVARTDNLGNFTLVVHNGQQLPRTDLIYVNASGNYTIRLDNCEYIQPYQYVEPPCGNDCSVDRILRPSELQIAANIFSGYGQTSVKNNSKHSIGVVGFDLAGRSTPVTVLTDVEVRTFLQRNNLSPTEFVWTLQNGLSLPPEIKWLGFYVSPNLNAGRYLQWIGDSMEYIDRNGNVTQDDALAEFVRINIDSLLQTNIANNFTLFSGYEFVRGDRLLVYDDGNGNLFDTATFGEPIDVEIYGTNYNQAAVAAGLVKSESQLVINEDPDAVPDPTTLLVRFDNRFVKLKDKTGFWIEIYQPSLQNDNLLFFETEVYPIVNGTIAQFTGFAGGQPQYNYLATAPIPYWDTYYIDRVINVPNVSTNYLNHPFESPNVTDFWGENYASGGRVNIENRDARTRWFRDDTIRSDEFINDGVINGLGLFRSSNRKSFKGYLWGGITATITQRSVILFICENDWFTANYNLNYARVDGQGNFVVVNLAQTLGDPIPKVGQNHGCEYEDTRSVVVYKNFVGYHDMKNGAYVLCDYNQVIDITDLKDGPRLMGIKSYYRPKTEFISSWNKQKPLNERVDVTAGIDFMRDELYVTFRPRRNNSNSPLAFVNRNRGYSYGQQETFVFSFTKRRWTRTAGFTPEGYGVLRGRESGVEMFSFANGQPYRHNDNSVTTFNTFYGQELERYITLCINNSPELNKVLQSIAVQSNRQRMFADLIFGNEPFSLSRISVNRFVEKENQYFAEVLMDESSYPPAQAELSYKSMLFDGKPIYGLYFVVRLVGDPLNKTEYQELYAIYHKYDAREASQQK